MRLTFICPKIQYHLSKDHHDLLPFWQNAVSLVSKSQGPTIKLHSLLTELHNEHEAMIPELLKFYHTKIKEREDSIKESRAKKIPDKKAERKKKLMQLLKTKKAKDKGDCTVDYIFTFSEEYEKYITLGCNNCLTSFYSGISFPVPTKYNTIKWLLIWETPRSIRQ